MRLGCSWYAPQALLPRFLLFALVAYHQVHAHAPTAFTHSFLEFILYIHRLISYPYSPRGITSEKSLYHFGLINMKHKKWAVPM